MEELVRQIEKTSLVELKAQLYGAAIRYAGLRARWALSVGGDRTALDSERTSAHDAFIDACNILSRNMASKGESIEWRRELGDDRKKIGDFACWLTLSLSLSAR